MKYYLFGIVCTAACLPALGNPAPLPPPAFPNTRVSALAQEYLRLCQTPSLDRFIQWLSANLDGATDDIAIEVANENLDFCRENGGVEAVEIVESSPGSLSLKGVGVKSGIWLALWWGVNEASKINSGGHSPTYPQEKYLPHDLSDAGVASYIRDRLPGDPRKECFPGLS